MPSVDTQRTLFDEVPSIFLLTICYTSFFGLTFYTEHLGIWVAIALLTPILVLHSSLQHELIHGHPTSIQPFNDLLAAPALSLFVPYLRFKDTHLAHHFDPNLTDPFDDPESNFYDPKVWNTLPKWQKTVLNANNTLFCRMLIGPIIGILSFYKADLGEILKGNRRIIFSYIHHLVFLSAVLFWMIEWAVMPIWALALASYLAMAILKIRTFLEHTAHKRVTARTVLIEDKGPLALLFLNNNFHSVHHTYPKLAWHKLPSKFYERKEEFLKKNNNYWFQSYWCVFRLYFFTQKDPVSHPLMEEYQAFQEIGNIENTSLSSDIVR